MNDADDAAPRQSSGFMRRVMHGLARLIPTNARGENPRAVQMFQRMDAIRDAVTRSQRRHGKQTWPTTNGVYVVGQPDAPVAICALTSNELLPALAALPGVAIAGRVYTPNLGIEKIIKNVTANPSIRFLLLCGKESPVFHPAQAIESLFNNGVDAEARIVGAHGPLPVLNKVAPERISAFRSQVELVNLTGELNTQIIGAAARGLVARNPGRYSLSMGVSGNVVRSRVDDTDAADNARFTPLRPGGQRQPLDYDPNGFFVIAIDRTANQVVLRHYAPDNTPRYLMRGHNAEAMLLGLLRENLVSQLSHAGYLGAELAKAEAALKLGLQYEQDQPLR